MTRINTKSLFFVLIRVICDDCLLVRTSHCKLCPFMKTVEFMPIFYLLQSVTPTPDIPFWQITQERVPYIVLVIIGLLAFVVGTILRPVLEDAANGLQNWVKGWGKIGDFRQRYLDWLIRENRYLSTQIKSDLAAQRQLSPLSIALEQMYTPLSLDASQQVDRYNTMSDARSQGTFKRLRARSQEWVPQWLQNLWQRIRPTQEPTAGEIGEIIWAHPRFLIRGHPGSGKSTLLRYLLLTCARTLRNNRKDGDRRNMVKERLGWQQRPFPIFVVLNRLTDVNTWPENRSLLDEISATLPSDLKCPPGFFETQLQRGNCFVMFDGFDELGSPTARGRMATLIAALIAAYPSPSNHFLVSTRIVGYEGQLDQYGFTFRTIQELDWEATETLVDRRYEAIALSDGFQRSIQEQSDLKRIYAERAQRLLKSLTRNQSLRRLIDNPLLLSLIVLVDLNEIALPDQRSLLYRNCVDILVHQWQASKREKAGVEPPPKLFGLSPANKIALLQTIAIAMHNRPHTDESHAVIERKIVETIIAQQLPNFIANDLPSLPDARQQQCEKFATLLLDNIHEESGILVGKGLSKLGEPLVSFSHLTFQEYLVADALSKNHQQLNILLDNLFSPSWREVLLLYVEMADANEVIQRCLDATEQHAITRYLLAGRCLAEKANVEASLRQRVMDRLRAYLSPPGLGNESIQEIFFRLGSADNYDWLIENLSDQFNNEEKRRLADPKSKATLNALYTNLQKTLVRIMQESPVAKTRATSGSVLSGLGDPRDLDVMIHIPVGKFLMGSDAVKDTLAYPDELQQHLLHLETYSISKYPVTNEQYLRFVQATGHRSPRHWQEERPLPWQLNHSVVNVSWHDACTYCAWLSKEKGKEFRLPTEAEWEKAARGSDGRIYPWGNDEPNELFCNFNNHIGSTTSVGIYPAGVSPYGLHDMAGNVWEWTGSLWGKDFSKPEFGYPYDAQDGRENLAAGDEVLRVVRGGAFRHNRGYVRCAVRYRNSPYSDWNYNGFRVVSPGC